MKSLKQQIKKLIKEYEAKPYNEYDAIFFAEQWRNADINIRDLDRVLNKTFQHDGECYVVHGGRDGEDMADDIYDVIWHNKINLDVFYANESEFIMKYADLDNVAIGHASFEDDEYWLIFI